MRILCLWALFLPFAHAADVCNPAYFPGAYGFLLSGTTTISGESKPVVSVARLDFESPGKVSGTSSVNFGGYFLGNPVTGEYTLDNDCSLKWKLQDDSGNYQNFAGKLSLDGKHVQFTQTDTGSPQRGAMVRSSGNCQSSDFRGRYRIAASGTTISMETGRNSGRVNLNGSIEADGNTGLRFTPDRDSARIESATFDMEGDCFVHLRFTNAGQSMNFRAVIVNDGKELLGIQTDPGTTVTLRLTAQ